MSVNLITGNLFSPIQASQDSDYQAGTFGEKTQILNVGSKMAVSIVDNSTIRCEDGVLVTKEGRRVQIDNGDVVEWTIPTGTQGTTSYYIVGFRLYTDDESAQLCDTFVQLVSGPGATITEDTFRDGAVEIFVSVARVVQNGITLESVESLVPISTTLDQVKGAISRINSDLSDKLTWTRIISPQSTIGQSITLPPGVNEVIITGAEITSPNWIACSITLTGNDIYPAAGADYVAGGMQTNAFGIAGTFHVSRGVITFTQFFVNNQSITSNLHFNVQYR